MSRTVRHGGNYSGPGFNKTSIHSRPARLLPNKGAKLPQDSHHGKNVFEIEP